MKHRARAGLPALLLLCWTLASAAARGADPAAEAAGATPNRAAPVGVEALMERFAASGGVRARFLETRHVSLLVAPIETEGLLYFVPPDRLARHTTRPGRASVVVQGDRVAVRDETGDQVLDLGSSELAHALVANLIAVLSGDLAALRERYSIEYRSDGETWALDLEPRSRVVRAVIEWIRFEGRGTGLLSMETRETNGDRSQTHFSEVETGLAPDPAELERIFSIERPDDAP